MNRPFRSQYLRTLLCTKGLTVMKRFKSPQTLLRDPVRLSRVSVQHCQKNSKMTGGMHWTSHWDLTVEQDLRGFSFNVMPNYLLISGESHLCWQHSRLFNVTVWYTHAGVFFSLPVFVLVACRQRDVSSLNYLCIFHTVTNVKHVHYTNVFYELTLHVNHQHLFSSS